MPKQKLPEKEEESPSQEIQRKYIQVQMLRQYLTAMAEEKAKVDEKTNEATLTAIAMRKLKEQPKGQEMWSAFGSDVFVMSDIKDREKVIVGIGAGVFVKKDVDEAVATIEHRKGELEKIGTSLAEEALRLQAELMRLEPELQALAEKAQKESPDGSGAMGG